MHHIIGKKILFITAHPDDESFLAGGTIWSNHLQGGKNFLYCASKGGKGTAYVDPRLQNKIKEVRETELTEAINYLKITKTCIDNFPDSSLENHIHDIKYNVSVYTESVLPDIIISFGEDGFTGHRDHIVLGTIARNIAHKLGIPFASFSHPPHTTCSKFKDFLSKKQLHNCYADKKIIHEPNIHVQVDGKKKFEILHIYKSQFEGLNPYNIFPEDVALHFLNNEYFYLES
jgi:LmbE family N-acetylglucosaminyl deacetylase